ncbi:cell division protein FtsW [Achromatium sp. WMS2]|nr:cell division protein FtsW [Achromatium sp. WMS2]
MAGISQGKAKKRPRPARLIDLDYPLLMAALTLLSFGLVMVASASLPTADRQYGIPFFYVTRHIIAMILGLGLGVLAFAVPMRWWEKHGTMLYFIGIFLLILILVPGLGKRVNGALRWIPIGPFNLQSSEMMKLFAVTYLAGYLVRRSDEVSNGVWGSLKPLLLLSIACVLIMAQPDFGTTAVVLATVLGMLFLGGAPLWQFGMLLGLISTAMAALVVFEPYRWQRMVSYLDPFDPEIVYGSGFQLSQALIAFGRGGWVGVGLGNGIQKQFYLPEAHTDFLLAVVGEEFGYAGVVGLLLIFTYVVWKAFKIGTVARDLKQDFSAYVAHGIGLGIALQAFVNVGVNVGLLPTKGLTLPYLSYGSNSIMIACVVTALVLRVGYENRMALRGEAPLPKPEGGETWDRS